MLFFQMVGLSVAPAILGLAQNTATDLENGLKAIFLAGAIAMGVSLLLISTLPEVSMDPGSIEKKCILKLLPIESGKGKHRKSVIVLISRCDNQAGKLIIPSFHSPQRVANWIYYTI
jgi:hypothetical protein